MKVVCIRHLPTPWNRQGLLQGLRDISIVPPDAAARESIRSNVAALKEMGTFDAVLCSPLARTRETAREHGFKPVDEALLAELDFGPFEGRPKAELLGQCDNAWIRDPRELELGEDMSVFQARIEAFVEKYRFCQRVLAFSHGAWTRALVAVAKTGNIKDMNRMEIPNNTIIEVEF